MDFSLILNTPVEVSYVSLNKSSNSLIPDVSINFVNDSSRLQYGTPTVNSPLLSKLLFLLKAFSLSEQKFFDKTIETDFYNHLDIYFLLLKTLYFSLLLD